MGCRVSAHSLLLRLVCSCQLVVESDGAKLRRDWLIENESRQVLFNFCVNCAFYVFVWLFFRCIVCAFRCFHSALNGAQGPINCMDDHDVTKDDVADLLVARNDGIVQVRGERSRGKDDI